MVTFAQHQAMHCPSSGQKAVRNLSRTEQTLSLLGGAALIPVALASRSWGRILSLAGAAALIQRGWTGHCSMYAAMGVGSRRTDADNEAVIPAQQGVKIEESVFINRPASELFAFWRELENLPAIMSHLKSVTMRADRTSHWVASGPLGLGVEWDAELLNLRENELIAWRSLPGSQIDTAGSVRFQPVSGRGTQLTVSLKYDPPGGGMTDAIAHFFGMGLEDKVQDDLSRFKQLMETGEIATTTGQPHGGR